MQAARGTSLSDLNDTAAPTPAPVRRPRLQALAVVVAAAGLTVDQLTKTIAVDRLTGRPDIEVVGELLQLHLTRNPGAAFSTGTGFTVALSCVAVLAAVVVAWLVRRVGSPLWALSLGLLLAGITGNLGDRLFRAPGPLRGHVVDFLMLPNWPVFNVADICITAAAVGIVLQTFRGIAIDGRRDGA